MRRRELGIGLAVLALSLGLFAWRPEFLERVEYQLYDWRFRLRGAEPPSAPIAIVAIDAKSVDELGRWPWRRSLIARLVDRLSDLEVSVIGFDVVFSEPETPPEIEPLWSASFSARTVHRSCWFRSKRVAPASTSPPLTTCSYSTLGGTRRSRIKPPIAHTASDRIDP